VKRLPVGAKGVHPLNAPATGISTD
jgi:hypothetical protein